MGFWPCKKCKGSGTTWAGWFKRGKQCPDCNGDGRMRPPANSRPSVSPSPPPPKRQYITVEYVCRGRGKPRPYHIED